MIYKTYVPGIRHSTPKLIHKLAALGKDCGTAVHSSGLGRRSAQELVVKTLIYIVQELL